MKTKRTPILLVVSSGQYETIAVKVLVTFTTIAGLLRRARQLQKSNAVYGDNWAGWIDARITIADRRDRWADNRIIGGRTCDPYFDWLDLSDGYGLQQVLAAKGVTK